MASSPKLFRKDPETDEISGLIRQYMREISSSMDGLEISFSKQTILLDHITGIVSRYIRPLASVLKAYEELPPPMGDDELSASAHAVDTATQAYSKAKTAVTLQQVAQLKQEAVHMEGVISHMLLPLRAAAKASKPPSSARRDPTGFTRLLLPLLLGPEEDFLTRCTNK